MPPVVPVVDVPMTRDEIVYVRVRLAREGRADFAGLDAKLERALEETT